MRNVRVVLVLWVVGLLGLAASAPFARAQGLSVSIVNGTKSAIPIVVVPFADNTVSPGTDVSSVVTMDLARSGQFRTLGAQDIVEVPSTGKQIDFPTWQLLKQDYIVVGHVDQDSSGGYTVAFELWNVNTKQQMLDLSYDAHADTLRRIAHEISDRIFQKITGIRGAFDTRIAYVTESGSGKDPTYSLVVADADGYNPQVVVRSQEPLMSPAWSPDGRELAYVSFESGDSAIYVQNLDTGRRKLVSARKGINSAPAFSPDGSKLAVSLSYNGNPHIYIIDLQTGRATQLTHGFAIDTSPKWMPDGNTIVFTSDRSGKPQLYRIPVTGGAPQRLTFQGQYNASASIGPDGKRIAMVQGDGNDYRIAVMDQSLDGQEHFVSTGDLDDTPSFAPNGTMLLYDATDGARRVLYCVSENGRVRQRLLLANGDVEDPAWGPFRSPG